MQSVHITTNVVSSNPTQTIQHYVIKFVSDSPGTTVSSSNKTNHQDITEMLLKMVLNTINQPYMQETYFKIKEFLPLYLNYLPLVMLFSFPRGEGTETYDPSPPGWE